MIIAGENLDNIRESVRKLKYDFAVIRDKDRPLAKPLVHTRILPLFADIGYHRFRIFFAGPVGIGGVHREAGRLFFPCGRIICVKS